MSHVVEVEGAVFTDVIEITSDGGPQGPPGDQRFYIGVLPPANTALLWINASVSSGPGSYTDEVPDPDARQVAAGQIIAMLLVNDEFDGFTTSGGTPPSAVPPNRSIAYQILVNDD